MKPIASVALDLDNKWSYLKTHGDAGWQSFPSYLNVVVPRILDYFDRHRLQISVFVVGQDAALEKNRDVLRSIADAGHEIANHSFSHDPWLHTCSEEVVEYEIAHAEECIEQLMGHKPVGFRGPGFSLSHTTLHVLAKRGYEYDATTFPNVLNPVARAYYLMNSNLSGEEKRRREGLFGSFADALRPVKPYRWRINGQTLTEIPVTTMPLLKTPIHFTYIMWLGTFSHLLACWYFRMALMLCRWTHTSPSLLFHPLDFLGCDDDQELGFFPGMRHTSDKKIALIARLLELVLAEYEVVTVRRHARRIAADDTIPLLEPKFRHP